MNSTNEAGPPGPGRGARLEPDPERFARLLRRFEAMALEELSSLPNAPAVGIVGAEGERLAAGLSRPIGEEPLEGGAEVIAAILTAASRASLTTNGPGYLAYIPGGGLPASVLADLASGGFNRYLGLAAAAPGFARLERDVLSWLAASFGYDARARGIFTSGGSLATLSAVVTARHAHFGEGGDYRDAAVYGSSEAHHSVGKALRVAGLPRSCWRELPVDGEFRLRVDALSEAVGRDRARGARPFLVVASAGTTNTGAVDPLRALAEVCAREGLWLHVDGAYGGAFVLTGEGRERFDGISLADSITFDPHKGFFLPYGTGALLVRDGAALHAAHRLTASYLQDLEGEDGVPSVTWNPSDLSPELTRDARGLRLWVPLMLHGVGAFRDALDEKLALARRFVSGLDALIARGAPLEVVARPQLTVTAFRLARRAGEPVASWDERNARLLQGVNERRRVYLSSTRLPVDPGGTEQVMTLRVCVLSFRTHALQIDHALADLEAAIPASG